MAEKKNFLDPNGVQTLFTQFLKVLNVTTDTIDKKKANIDSPALIGTPTAPTAKLGTSTDQIATTAFVQQSMSASIFITTTPATPNITVTAYLTTDPTKSYSATTNSAGTAIIGGINKYGLYNIKYSDTRAHGDTMVDLQNNIQYMLDVTYNEKVTYTIKINTIDSGTKTAVTYLDDAINMTKGSADWDKQPIFNDIIPLVLKDGTVQYKLNPKNFAQKVDGTAANIDGTDGDVMIRFGKFGYKIFSGIEGDAKYGDTNALYVSITNDDEKGKSNGYCYDAFSRLSEGDLGHMFVGAYDGSLDGDITSGTLHSRAGALPATNGTIAQFRSAAQRNGAHYQIMTYGQLKAIQCLYLIKYGDRNGQDAVGQGVTGISWVDNHKKPYITGYDQGVDITSNYNTMPSMTLDASKSTAAKGMTYGGNSTEHMRLFGIEDFWGNLWQWVDGFYCESIDTTNGAKIRTSWRTFVNGDTGEGVSGEEVTYFPEVTSNLTWRWVTKVGGDNNTGFVVRNTDTTGSGSTYWADYGGLYAGCVARFGARWSDGSAAGPFYLDVGSGVGGSGYSIGARVCYK